ncbi:MAG TPA: NAD-dependent epimerase/dehydratase family protein [Burkholderiales bacterium]|nr:NAD-dependent epimerase/dehydratase family protein [Burkholderiales bacterium]
MKIFLTGATGYIGGSVGARLVALGHEVYGLVRSTEGAKAIEARGMQPVAGTLDDAAVVAAAAKAADAVFDTAEANHPGVVDAIAAAVRGSGKFFLHTSGSGIVATDAKGEAVDAVYDEYSAFTPAFPRMVQRAAIDKVVFDCAKQGVRSVVIRPTMIYGGGKGVRTESAQVPALIDNAKKAGVGLHIGRGENIWSNVHIDDVVDLYLLALEKAPAGALYYAENGEEKLKDVVASISRLLGFGGRTRNWSPEDAEKALGPKAHSSFASNSRVRAKRARAELAWKPKGPSIFEEIERGHYKRACNS